MAPRNGATVGAAVALALVLFISGTAARKTALAAVDNPFATRRLQQTCPGGQSTFCQVSRALPLSVGRPFVQPPAFLLDRLYVTCLRLLAAPHTVVT